MRIVTLGKLVAATLVSAPVLLQAATLTLSPSVVSNDFAGTISLTITGLAGGATVLVEKYTDANHNGVIDPGEPLMQSFTVQDGQLPRLGGVPQPEYARRRRQHHQRSNPQRVTLSRCGHGPPTL